MLWAFKIFNHRAHKEHREILSKSLRTRRSLRRKAF